MKEVKYSEILKENRKTTHLAAGGSDFRIQILSNITCNQLKEIFVYYLQANGIRAQVGVGNYDNIVQDSYQLENQELVVIHYDLFALLDKSPEFVENMQEEEIGELVLSVQQELDIIFNNVATLPAVLFNLFTSGIWGAAYPSFSKADKIAKQLNEYVLAKKRESVFVVSLDKIFQQSGVADLVDFKMYYLSGTLYNVTFWKHYVLAVSSILLKLAGKVKKAIVFDCDNTLWKGVVGEDGETGIDMNPQSKIGQIFRKIQQMAVWLSKSGVLVCLCSKNNAADIDAILASHPDMLLRDDIIILKKVNWQDKATNLREIAASLNIGADSLVFVDDSAFEINLVKEQLPAVKTFQVPEALSEYPFRLLEFIHQYFYFSGTEEDFAKTRQYKEQLTRNIEKQKYTNLEEYLASLQMEISIQVNDFSKISRISQLTQKTNQFNLTTQRYSESQIEQFMKDPSYQVYSAGVADKFGDNGLTAVCILKKETDHVCSIDTFLMSCRIMGRTIENKIMDYLISQIGSGTAQVVKARYLATVKNRPVENLFEKMGFEVLEVKGADKYYQLALDKYRYNNINYIKIKENGSDGCNDSANHG